MVNSFRKHFRIKSAIFVKTEQNTFIGFLHGELHEKHIDEQANIFSPCLFMK